MSRGWSKGKWREVSRGNDGGVVGEVRGNVGRGRRVVRGNEGKLSGGSWGEGK